MFTILESDFIGFNVEQKRCLKLWRVTSLASIFSKNDVYNFEVCQHWFQCLAKMMFTILESDFIGFHI